MYTYEDFQKALGSTEGVYFSPYDLDLAQRNPNVGMSLLELKQKWNNTTDAGERQLLNDQANKLRADNGLYTGGKDGSEFNPLGSKNQMQANNALDDLLAAGSFNYENPYAGMLDDAVKNLQSMGSFQWEGKAPTYTNQYAETQKGLLNSILNRDPFSYDRSQDPQWAAYAKQYRREGDRATANALGQAAAASGGRPSSYAQTAATQAGDYYSGKLADIIPQLYQQAYDRYLKEYSMKQQDLAAVNSQEQMDYSKFLNDLGQYNTDRNFALNAWGANQDQAQALLNAMLNLDNQKFGQAYNTWSGNVGLLADKNSAAQNAYQNELAQQNWQNQFDYGKQQDALAQQNWLAQFEYNKLQDALAQQNWQKKFDWDKYMDQLNYDYKLQNSKRDKGDGDGDGEYGLNDLNKSSVIDLGIGPIGFDEVEKLVEQGLVTVYTDKNGKLSVKWADGFDNKNYKDNMISGTLPSPAEMMKMFGTMR